MSGRGVRRLPSGRWQATVWLPLQPGQTTRRRATKTFDLRSQAIAWRDELLADLRRGDVLNPRDGDVTVGELWERYGLTTRRLEAASRDRDLSHWRTHTGPRWRDVPVGAITRPDVRRWIADMERAGTGAWTIHAAVRVLRAVLEAAVETRIIRTNPAAGVTLPPPPEHVDRVLEPGEDEQLLAALDEHVPGRADGRLLAELMLWCGLRWSEAAALDRDHVLMRDRLLMISRVVERSGRIRTYPKSGAGRRAVPVPDHLWPRLRERVMSVGPGGLLVTAPRGGVLRYATWRSRVWEPAVKLAGLEPPDPTGHDLRHTYGTRLARAGVPAHEIMALMGHSSLRSVQRYLHAGPGRFDQARSAMAAFHTGHASNVRADLVERLGPVGHGGDDSAGQDG